MYYTSRNAYQRGWQPRLTSHTSDGRNPIAEAMMCGGEPHHVDESIVSVPVGNIGNTRNDVKGPFKTWLENLAATTMSSAYSILFLPRLPIVEPGSPPEPADHGIKTIEKLFLFPPLRISSLVKRRGVASSRSNHKR